MEEHARGTMSEWTDFTANNFRSLLAARSGFSVVPSRRYTQTVSRTMGRHMRSGLARRGGRFALIGIDSTYRVIRIGSVGYFGIGAVGEELVFFCIADALDRNLLFENMLQKATEAGSHKRA